jgi:hypothetical protein
MCDDVWNTPSVEVPKPSLNPKQRVKSSSNLLNRPSMDGFDGYNYQIKEAADENPFESAESSQVSPFGLGKEEETEFSEAPKF